MKNQLVVIVEESGLTGSKAQFILENFQDYFKVAAEWETKARTLVVTRPEQKAEMALARDGRLFLREKRLAIENSRKKLKEDVLREGKAIDGIANVLKALIEPIEKYLDEQEHFVEIQEKKKEDAHRAEVEARMAKEDEDRRLAEEAKAAKLQAENEKLRKQNEAAAAKLKAERDKAKEASDKVEADRREALRKADAERAKIEEKARLEREKAEADKRKAAEVAKKKLDAERADKERLEALLKAQVTCPKCSHKFVPEKK